MLLYFLLKTNSFYKECLNDYYSKVDCDYYNFLRGDRSAFNSYRGEYMTQYSWAEVTRSALRQQAAATPKSGSIPSYYVPPTGF